MNPGYDVYLMPGLGLDQRIFENLSIQAENVVRLNWLEPERKETLGAYVRRLARPIKDNQRPVALIGHSFGGIVVQEMQRFVRADKLILLSTIASPDELPLPFRFLRYIPLHACIRSSWTSRSIDYWGSKHGYHTERLKTLYCESANRLSSYYFRWAIGNVIHWRATAQQGSVLRLHGTEDRTFPCGLTGECLKIEGGDHLMVYKRGEEISELINRYLEKEETGETFYQNALLSSCTSIKSV